MSYVSICSRCDRRVETETEVTFRGSPPRPPEHCVKCGGAMWTYTLTEQECVKVAELCGWRRFTQRLLIGYRESTKKQDAIFPEDIWGINGVEVRESDLQSFIHNPLNIGYLLTGLADQVDQIEMYLRSGYSTVKIWMTVERIDDEPDYHEDSLKDPIGHTALLHCLKQLISEEG